MITGKSVGAGMFETMAILGKEECMGRFEWFLANGCTLLHTGNLS
jgi:hypothetical protein